MAITIREVAKELNLSITTISRALDGYDDVSEKTRDLVVRTAREMGYSPNRAARQLRRQRSDTIGYILPEAPPRFVDPFFHEFIAGVGDEAAARNYDLLIATAAGQETGQQTYQRWANARKVDGFILNRIRLRDWRIQYLAELNLPFITLERSLDPVDYPSIQVDSQAGIAELVAHLAAQGRQRIAFIGASAELTLQADRFAGYRAGLQSAGLAFDPRLVATGDLTQAGGYLAAQALLDLPEPPAAIMCVNDLTALGVLRLAQERGLRLPEQLAVTGFDGIEAAQNTHPPLTTLVQPLYDIARQMVSMLIDVVEGRPLPETKIRLKPELIIRASSMAEV